MDILFAQQIKKYHNKTYQNFKINDFPINKEMAFFFKEKKKKCKKHDNFLEYFCMSCEEEICALCGLFGLHKDHKITTNKELKSINSTIIETTKNNFETFTFFEDYSKNENFSDLVRIEVDKYLKKSKDVLMKQYHVF